MKNFRWLLIATVAVSFMICVNCFGKVSGENTVAKDVNEGDIKQAVTGNNDFAFALYAKLKNDSKATAPQGNLFFSPYSISTALAMTYAGARGETEKQMAATLHFTLPQGRLHPAFGALEKQLIQPDKSRGYELLVANALWGQKGEPFLPDFLNLTKTSYGAELTQLDFVNDPEKSRQTINLWVEKKTADKIKDLIPKDAIDELTRLVLTNAIYFKGTWKTQFDKKDTKDVNFSVSAAEKIKVPMMYLKKEFKYGEDDKLQILELPYKGDELSMLVLLPKDSNGLKTVEDGLTTTTLNSWRSGMHSQEVMVYLPKLKMTWGTFSLNEPLTALGMADAFDGGKADFSGMNGKRDLSISDVFHKAFVEVNEEGTEAAAATAVVMRKSMAREPIVFRADHPFVFIIRDNRTGSILFIGRVVNPVVQ